MPEFLINEARPEEAPLLAAIHALSLPHPWSEAEISATMRSPHVKTLAAFDGGSLAGFIIYRLAAGECEILTFAVHPDFRRLGIGKSLASSMLAENAGNFFLDVAENNIAALKLYESLGFKRIGHRPDYYGSNIAAILMSKESP